MVRLCAVCTLQTELNDLGFCATLQTCYTDGSTMFTVA